MSDLDFDVIRVNLFETQPLGRGRAARMTILSGPDAGDYEVLLDGADRHYLFIAVPRSGGRAVRPAPGVGVSILVSGPGGTCAFESVVAQVGEEEANCIAILLPAEAQRMQRRKHMRMAITLPLRIARLPREGEGVCEGLRFAKARTSNISERGLSLTCRGLDCAPGDLVALSFDLPPRRRVTATAEVLRAEDGHGYAVRFSDIDERAQVEIARYIKEKRREARAAAGAAVAKIGGKRR